MERPRGKATQPSRKAGAAAPKCSARSARGAQAEPGEFPPASGPGQPGAGRCSPAAQAEASQDECARDPPEKPQARPPGARPKKAPRGAGGARPEGAVPLEGTEAPGAVPAEEPDSSASLGPPLPQAGPRRPGAQAPTRERRSVTGPKELRPPGPQAAAAGPERSESAPKDWKPRRVLESLKLRRAEISRAAEVVNRVVDHLQRTLQCRPSAFSGISLLRAGSYYEHVKISAPNEFDVMFTLNIERIQLEEYLNSSAFYFVKLKRNPKGNPLSQFLEGEILSASKMLAQFRTIINKEIKNIEGTDIVLQRKKKGSPAVTLLIKHPMEISVDIILALQSKSSWPASTTNGLPIQKWLGAKVRRDLRLQPYYLVPKHAKEGHSFQEETWRLSFSNIEKDILNNHGQSKTCCETNGEKCCRKECLKLMKYLLEQLKKKFEKRRELDKFCSYHVKTAFFHLCSQDPCDSQWHFKDLEQCFENCVTHFLQCLQTERLAHYFIPGLNLFSPDKIGKANQEFLLKQIEYERDNGFPVFGEY
ncbi:cyclic GMP-AMP synthase [Tenrec ecaudatus]|uniref:cyclic GMP-AMP synthase n=1 Tax=Tenrec ecaudatus TaxID=94439 RepID=UPI003F594D2E